MIKRKVIALLNIAAIIIKLLMHRDVSAKKKHLLQMKKLNGKSRQNKQD